jgi:hypothetical protein
MIPLINWTAFCANSKFKNPYNKEVRIMNTKIKNQLKLIFLAKTISKTIIGRTKKLCKLAA